MAQSTSGLFTVEKLPGATFGAVVRFGGKGARAAIAALDAAAVKPTGVFQLPGQRRAGLVGRLRGGGLGL